MRTSVAIVGGGLSGLYLAFQLARRNIDYVLVEARDRLGGRVYSPGLEGDFPQARYDLGPAWIWPQLQPLMQDLLHELAVESFPQHTRGALLYEQQTGIQQYTTASAHSQSFRIRQGGARLIQSLHERMEPRRILLQSRAVAVHHGDHGLQLELQSGQQLPSSIEADHLVLALPPRLIAEHIDIAGIDATTIEQWRQTPTWMAGHAKILFIYQAPFWRQQGLSGEVFSQRGPMTEIYDASPAEDASAEAPGSRVDTWALFGFIGIPADMRESMGEQAIVEACQAQLARLFSTTIPEPLQVMYKDWSQDALTATSQDKMPLRKHPDYASLNARKSWFDDRLILAGSEMAELHGGYLEGALEAAETALAIIMRNSRRPSKTRI